jgi:uncharacterized protein
MMAVEHTPFNQFLAGLEDELRRLPFPNQLAFAASCCERAVPNYVIFSQLQHWGDPTVLRSGIDEAWGVACGQAEQRARLKELEDRCKVVTPNSEAFPATDVTAAQEAAFMAALLLQFCLEKKPSYPVRIATFARDTIDLYVQTHESLDAADPLLEEKIARHPLMQRELETQIADLNSVKRANSPSDMRYFMARATAIRISNIGVPI